MWRRLRRIIQLGLKSATGAFIRLPLQGADGTALTICIQQKVSKEQTRGPALWTPAKGSLGGPHFGYPLALFHHRPLSFLPHCKASGSMSHYSTFCFPPRCKASGLVPTRHDSMTAVVVGLRSFVPLQPTIVSAVAVQRREWSWSSPLSFQPLSYGFEFGCGSTCCHFRRSGSGTGVVVVRYAVISAIIVRVRCRTPYSLFPAACSL